MLLQYVVGFIMRLYDEVRMKVSELIELLNQARPDQEVLVNQVLSDGFDWIEITGMEIDHNNFGVLIELGKVVNEG